MSIADSIKLNLSAGLASVAIAGVMVGLKLWAYGTTGSLSVAASLADSAMDLMVSLGAMAALIYAAKPADEDHAFGHSSAEDLAALGQADRFCPIPARSARDKGRSLRRGYLGQCESHFR